MSLLITVADIIGAAKLLRVFASSESCWVGWCMGQSASILAKTTFKPVSIKLINKKQNKIIQL